MRLWHFFFYLYKQDKKLVMVVLDRPQEHTRFPLFAIAGNDGIGSIVPDHHLLTDNFAHRFGLGFTGDIIDKRKHIAPDIHEDFSIPEPQESCSIRVEEKDPAFCIKEQDNFMCTQDIIRCPRRIQEVGSLMDSIIIERQIDIGREFNR